MGTREGSRVQQNSAGPRESHVVEDKTPKDKRQAEVSLFTLISALFADRKPALSLSKGSVQLAEKYIDPFAALRMTSLLNEKWRRSY